MRAKKITDTINEWGGAGYSIYGGNAGYGNASGRGMGFGQSSQNKGGPNLMYTYDVKDLDQKLQQAPTPQDDEKYIHVGCEIKGISLDTKKKITGKILSEETDNDGNILYYKVINSNTGKSERVDPTSVELIQNDLSPEMSVRDVVGESINFERGTDSKQAMDIGVNRIYCELLSVYYYGNDNFSGKKLSIFETMELLDNWENNIDDDYLFNCLDKSGHRKSYTVDDLEDKTIIYRKNTYKIPNS